MHLSDHIILDIAWYSTWWGGLLIVIIITVAITVFYRWRIKRSKRNQENLEALIAERTEELARKNDELELLSRQKDHLASLIVHDLKNPLNAIVNADIEDDPRAQIKRIKQSGSRMLNMVMDILDVSRAENTGMEINAEHRNVKEIVTHAVDQVRYLAEQRNVKIHTQVESDLGVHADAELMERIFINLFTNAIKFSPAGGQFDIVASAYGDEWVRVEVVDNGPGILPDVISTIFSRFGQLKKRRSGELRSTGLGLTFCKMAVEAHGGTIGVDSVVDQGSTFWFTLPRGKVTTDSNNITPAQEALEITLSDDARAKLKPLVEELSATAVYRVSAIRDIIATVSAEEDEGVYLWKEELLKAAIATNTSKYEELIKQINE